MSDFGSVSTEAQKPKVKFSSDFIKTTSDHQTVIRVLDDKPEVSWSHFVPKGHHAFPKTNNGKGMSFMCPGSKVCPICAWNSTQKAKDPTTKDVLNARKLYTFNVLERTKVVVCPSCGAEHYEKASTYPDVCDCGANLASIEPTPREKVMIMQKGRKVVEQLQTFEADKDFGDLREYDIKLDTRGQGTEMTTTCVPRNKQKLDLVKTLGADWKTKLHDIKQIATPLKPSQIQEILDGKDFYSTVKANEPKGS
jgi:hypothetical protein